jgi:hypothetical protein
MESRLDEGREEGWWRGSLEVRGEFEAVSARRRLEHLTESRPNLPSRALCLTQQTRLIGCGASTVHYKCQYSIPSRSGSLFRA